MRTLVAATILLSACSHGADWNQTYKDQQRRERAQAQAQSGTRDNWERRQATAAAIKSMGDGISAAGRTLATPPPPRNATCTTYGNVTNCTAY